MMQIRLFQSRKVRIGLAVLALFVVAQIAAHVTAVTILGERKKAWMARMAAENPAMAAAYTPAQDLSREDFVTYRAEYARLNETARYAFSTIYNMGPSFDGRFFKTDERGFRVVSPPANPTAPRVAFFGGSVAWGVETETNALTIPAQFQELSSGRFQAVNYAMPSYNMTGDLLMFLSVLARDHAARPLDAAIFYETWNECHSALWRLPGKAPPPHASDGLRLDSAANTILFQRELEDAGKVVFDRINWGRVWSRLAAIPGDLWKKERIHRLIPILSDPNYLPSRVEALPERPGIKATDAEIAAALDVTVALYADQKRAVRAAAEGRGIQPFFVMPPMAFTKTNPAPDEYNPSDYSDRLMRPCYDRMRAAFGNEPDFIDLSGMALPDRRVYADYGHMVGAGTAPVARKLLEILGPRIKAGVKPGEPSPGTPRTAP